MHRSWLERFEKLLKVCTAKDAQDVLECLLSDDVTFISHLPVSVVSKKSKLKFDIDERLALFDGDGEAKEHYSLIQLQELFKEIPKLFQTIDVALVDDQTKFLQLTYQNKRANDYWKRLISVDGLLGMVYFRVLDADVCQENYIENALETTPQGQWSVEQSLRDDMRSKKENPRLRGLPYMTLFSVASDTIEHVEGLVQHYFSSEYITVKTPYYTHVIGYSTSLDAISLRAFYKKREK